MSFASELSTLETVPQIHHVLKSSHSKKSIEGEKRNDVVNNDQPGLSAAVDTDDGKASKKPFSFWMSFVALNTTVFICSLDSTALAVAIPVCSRY